MKRVLFLAVIAVMASCGEPGGNVVYSGHKWDIVKLNDSTFLAVPGLNAKSDLKPVLLGLDQLNKYKQD